MEEAKALLDKKDVDDLIDAISKVIKTLEDIKKVSVSHDKRISKMESDFYALRRSFSMGEEE